METYYLKTDEDCCDTCIACLIGECDHFENMDMDIERNKDKFYKVIKEIQNIYDGDCCSPKLRIGDKDGNEFQKFIFQSYLYNNNKYPYRKGDHKYPFEEEEEEYIDPFEFWCRQQERIRDNPFPYTPRIQKDRT